MPGYSLGQPEVQLRAVVITTAVAGLGLYAVPEPVSEYADVTEMFGRLRTLDEGSVAYRRQREEIIGRTLPLADHIARRFRNRGEPDDDLVQAARVGLVNAVNRFDPDNGADFFAFAVPTMMGEVRRHFRDYGWAVKVPRRLKDLQGQMVRPATRCRRRTVVRRPLPRSQYLGIDRETVIEATIASSNYSTLSTDVQAGPDTEYRAMVTPWATSIPTSTRSSPSRRYVP